MVSQLRGDGALIDIEAPVAATEKEGFSGHIPGHPQDTMKRATWPIEAAFAQQQGSSGRKKS
jgi:hypothetical protein